MSDHQIASVSIEYVETDNAETSGFYYEITDASGDVSDPIGPFESVAAAEINLNEAIRMMMANVVKESLGLE